MISMCMIYGRNDNNNNHNNNNKEDVDGHWKYHLTWGLQERHHWSSPPHKLRLCVSKIIITKKLKHPLQSEALEAMEKLQCVRIWWKYTTSSLTHDKWSLRFPTVNLKTSPMNLIYTTKLCQIYYSHYLLTAKNSHITMITSFSHNLKIDRGHHCHFPSRIRFALRFVLMFGSLEFWHQMREATSITRAIAKIIVLSGWKHFIRLDSKWFKNRVRWLFSISQWNM